MKETRIAEHQKRLKSEYSGCDFQNVFQLVCFGTQEKEKWMPVPDYQTFMGPTLELSQTEQKYSQAVQKIGDLFNLTKKDIWIRIETY